jgi:hypothetical protein
MDAKFIAKFNDWFPGSELISYLFFLGKLKHPQDCVLSYPDCKPFEVVLENWHHFFGLICPVVSVY